MVRIIDCYGGMGIGKCLKFSTWFRGWRLGTSIPEAELLKKFFWKCDGKQLWVHHTTLMCLCYSAFTLATCCHTSWATCCWTCCSPCISMEPFTLATCCSTCVATCGQCESTIRCGAAWSLRCPDNLYYFISIRRQHTSSTNIRDSSEIDHI